jgi:hypothetical protein
MHAPWRTVLDLASDQYGLVTRAQIIGLCVTGRMIDRAVADGLLVRVATRVYAVRGAPRTERMAIAAAVLATDGDASHVTGASLLRFRSTRWKTRSNEPAVSASSPRPHWRGGSSCSADRAGGGRRTCARCSHTRSRTHRIRSSRGRCGGCCARLGSTTRSDSCGSTSPVVAGTESTSRGRSCRSRSRPRASNGTAVERDGRPTECASLPWSGSDGVSSS